MVYLTADSMNNLSNEELKKEALTYSNLCRVQSEILRKQEVQLKKMADQLGFDHQLVLFTQNQLEQMKHQLFGQSSDQRTDLSGLPLFDPTQEERERTQFGRTPQPELPRVEILFELPEDEIKAQGLEKIEGQFEISEQINVTAAKYEETSWV